MYDDATQIGESKPVRLEKGIQTVELEAILPVPGLHKLSFEITSPGDTLAQNNAYNTYVNIEIFDKLLIIESIAGESDSLRDIMTDKKVTVVNVADEEKMPKTVDELREYDEVILVNISNSDMPQGFDEVLYSYVHDIGGGLFTVCGNKEDSNPNDDQWEANAFTRDDMYGSLYQQLLPVEVVEYTPPVAVVIVIDCSGSMYDPKGSLPYEKSKLYAAKQGAEACLESLDENDWVGITTFSDKVNEDLELTRRTDRDKILAAIESIPQNGGETKFAPALASARMSLLNLSSVEKKHIIIVTDGAPTDTEEKYGAEIKRNAEAGITMSIVGIDCASPDAAKMKEVLATYAELPAERFHDVKDISAVPTEMRKDLEVPEIKDVNYVTYTPGVSSNSSILNGIDISKMPSLDGFYGSKVKEGTESKVEVILSAPYVPIYAQWKVGKGTVGSFMRCFGMIPDKSGESVEYKMLCSEKFNLFRVIRVFFDGFFDFCAGTADTVAQENVVTGRKMVVVCGKVQRAVIAADISGTDQLSRIVIRDKASPAGADDVPNAQQLIADGIQFLHILHLKTHHKRTSATGQVPGIDFLDPHAGGGHCGGHVQKQTVSCDAV